MSKELRKVFEPVQGKDQQIGAMEAIRELCACGSLPHVRIGRPGSRGCIRLTEADIQEFLASQKIGGEAPARLPPKQQRVFKHVIVPN